MLQLLSNQQEKMNKYQRRVQISMERLNIPSWYRSTSSNTPTRLAASRSASCPTGWRRHLSQPLLSLDVIKNQELSVRLSNSDNLRRGMPAKSSNHSCVPYLGWRHEYNRERLYYGPPHRLARSCSHILREEKELSRIVKK